MGRTAAYLLAIAWGAVPALAALLCLLPWRKRRLGGSGYASPLRREGAMALFWMFCGGMAVLTLTPRWVVWSLVDLLHGYRWNVGDYPFFSLGSANWRLFQTIQFSPYFLAGNIVMFVPFGFFPALLWRGCTWKRALGTGLAVTGCIECWQLCVGRAFDIDDLFFNALGVLGGFWLWALVKRRAPDFTGAFQVRPSKE